jgi:uncharacterized BrkB/YihY/UPF0761 family membrane protein
MRFWHDRADEHWDMVAMALAFTTALAFAAALILTFSVATSRDALDHLSEERIPRSATATPGRDERWGVWGPFVAPM